MKQQKLIFISAGLLLVAYYSWLLFGSGDWFFTHSKNTPNRAALLKMREEIQIGDGYEAVLKSFWQHTTRDLRLDAGGPQTWTVSMPYELAARNWVMYVEFSNGKVSALKVRTSDGPRPHDAPADVTVKVFFPRLRGVAGAPV